MRSTLLSLAIAFAVAAAPAATGVAAAPDAGQSKPAERKAAPKADAKKAAPPKVSEIKEAGLKELLERGRAAGRPLLVNFWATWCVPCREEFPDLVRLRADYPAEKLEFALVSLDDPSEINGSVPAFLAEMRASDFASYLLNADDPDVAIKLLDTTWYGELPATFLLDRAGKVVYKHKGRIKVAELSAALDAALAPQ